MVTRKARILVLIFVLADVLTTCGAWLLAYYARFYSEPFLTLLPASKGVPALARYALLIPLIAVLWPIVLYFHGLYRFRRGRSRIDELFAILLSVVIASALALSATLYIRVYHRYQPDVAPLWEFSQGVFAIFIALDVLSISAGRAAIRSYLKKRWSAGHNAERILIAGAGELGQTVAEALIAHKDLGYQVVGFLDDSPSTLPAGAPPLLGSLQDVLNVIQAQRVDQLYLALPLESHAEMLKLIKALRNECLDVRVVPDLLQYAAIKAT
ncbi:MAG: hypothetical protein MUF51_11570, partial [Vicinamibacteria bacterium]|nr:hypothetical protein [Vicinamibacteria bacterium]